MTPTISLHAPRHSEAVEHCLAVAEGFGLTPVIEVKIAGAAPARLSAEGSCTAIAACAAAMLKTTADRWLRWYGRSLDGDVPTHVANRPAFIRDRCGNLLLINVAWPICIHPDGIRSAMWLKGTS